MQTYLGEVHSGTIVLDPPVVLPEGAKVRVTVESVEAKQESVMPTSGATLLERLKPFIGAIDDLPADFAAEHDHYIHGAPKRNG